MTKKASPNQVGYDLILSALKRNPKVEYSAIAKKAEAQKLKIYPIMYGRALRALGLVKKGAKKKVVKRKKPPKVRTRVTAKPAKVDMLADLRAIVRENQQLKRTLERVRDLTG